MEATYEIKTKGFRFIVERKEGDFITRVGDHEGYINRTQAGAARDKDKRKHDKKSPH